MSLLFRITSEMYFTRNRRKLLIIDELKQQLGTDEDSVLTLIIEEAARRARKYGGSLITATHQVEDYHESPALLTAFALSDAVFILRQRKESVELLARSGQALDGRTQEARVAVPASGEGFLCGKFTPTRRWVRA